MRVCAGAALVGAASVLPTYPNVWEWLHNVQAHLRRRRLTDRIRVGITDTVLYTKLAAQLYSYLAGGQ